MTDDGTCPFQIGQTVFYRPSDKGTYLTLSEPPGWNPKFGVAVRVTDIEQGKYVVWEGCTHPGGGIYWTGFSPD